MDRETEIAQIDHELEILRERYNTYARSARTLRFVFWVWFPIVLFLILVAIAKSFFEDALMGIFFGGIIGAVCLLLWLLGGFDPRAFRWIDIASMQWSRLSLDAAVPSGYHQRRSDAQLIEEQIAERERRLSELIP